MPDIGMCPKPATDCTKATSCHRNMASGTQPSEFRQSWLLGFDPWPDCRHYWPKENGHGEGEAEEGRA